MTNDARASLSDSSELTPASSTDSELREHVARTSTRSPAPTFECFGRLPEELRIMIWDAAMVSTEPRVVDLCQFRPKHLRENTKCSTFESTPFAYGTLSKPPIVDVSREARRAAQHHYSMEFGTKLSVEGPPFVWVNWSRDIFLPIPPYYNENAMLRDLCHKETRRFALATNMVLTFLPTLEEYYPCLSEVIIYDCPQHPYEFHPEYFSRAQGIHFELAYLSENLEDELRASVMDSRTRSRYLDARQDIQYYISKRDTISQGSKREGVRISFASLRINARDCPKTVFTIKAKPDSVT
ncbi:hypothetical protein BDZ45DRAFT_224854 [Acephala macrosclerotiorum]|nr:hypothetical protein BDZ45DRAFT_224854 [Acephala macrosclerotiorum]